MSWYGQHPVVSREVARRHLPPGACKLTVYRVRCSPKHYQEDRVHRCERCGVEYNPAEVSRAINEELESSIYFAIASGWAKALAGWFVRACSEDIV